MSRHSSSTGTAQAAVMPARLPWMALLALAMTGFICILTETIPAGLLPLIGDGLHITTAMAGQLVTLYAIGSLVAAIPFAMLTGGVRRRPLLLAIIVGFLVFNTITALSTSYALTLIARFFAGVAAGAAWGMIAGYARRMVPDALKGRALAVAMVGTPIALTFGVPVGTLLGDQIGWRAVFVLMSFLALILIGWVLWKVPDYPGQPANQRMTVRQVFVMPCMRPILTVVLTWMLAHNILYTYIAPFLERSGLAGRVDLVLLVFGSAALVSIWIVGILIDRILRMLVLISLSGFALVSIALWIGGTSVTIVYSAVALWGFTFGGAATLLQSAQANASGEEGVDIAMPINTTVWNLAIACGGIVGGALLELLGVQSFPGALLILLIVSLMVAWSASKHGFPGKQ
ncbi:MFS transporter [Paenibacillus chitinolyticus]|uniref:MFS transporter n=1 Tax=Paenibacillus chitinolyticus TaxID=79263 RepID=A0A410WYC9_9BACL|nr:MFS transporter [Paenibacillus chitinolyticus]MCY9589978.1 MFS transporter [Paenibacillus chitinolyticus]MCY9596315.1 MFS transporter [Paenibacillus chitinolyticus]QAV19343.1 MFS transporter [Paenibacillus chitinolyticus]